jgi:CheY-like chemotaxis protein
MDLKKNLIVIADDDPDDQYIIRQAIMETGTQSTIVLVKNGLELMELLQRKGRFAEQALPCPDLVIMDLNMPLLDGYGVLQKVRKTDGLKDIPIYVISTSRFEYDHLKSLDYGATDFFSKPYHFDDLKEIIREICNRTLELEKTTDQGAPL